METNLVEKENVLTSSPVENACLLPFEQESSDELRDELGTGRGPNWDARTSEWPLTGFRKRGNFVKSYILTTLRIEAKSIRPRVSWILEGLWDRFPTELICSIYCLLHPIDLYHAICATKTLRRFLLNKNASFIWKETFLNHPDIPFYPDDVSAPKWASLLFGPATCDTCGMNNCLVEYAVRSRKCVDCKDYYPYNRRRNVFLDAIKPIIGEFPYPVSEIWSLAFEIRRFDSFLYPREGYHRTHYSLNQVLGLAKEMRKYLLEVQSGAPEGKSNYETYLKAARVMAVEREKYSSSFQLPTNIRIYYYSALGPGKCYGSKDILKGMRRRLDRSVRSTVKQVKTFKISPETDDNGDHDYDRSSPRRTPATRHKRTSRVYSHYNHATVRLLTHRARSRYIHPNDIESVCNLEFFSDYINDPDNLFVPLDYDTAQPEIRRFLETRLAAQKHLLFMLLLERGVLPQEANKDSQPDRYLELAIAVFRCSFCGQACVGWEEAIAHRHSDCPQEKFDFCESAYQALQIMFDVLRLDSDSLRTIKYTDLDAMDKRFISRICLSSFSWRECVDQEASVIENSESTVQYPTFDVLTEAQTKHGLAYGRPLTKARVIRHNHELHNVAKPVENVDFCFIHTREFPEPTPFFIGLNKNANHRCLRCPPGTHKLWMNKDHDLYRHLWDKHDIKSADLREGVDKGQSSGGR
ncbi:hypothetical protein BDN70DRAFT_898992 [Pholiota conissans]|uniref:F-box domain-containing protein n=1 Tax=Pholiota conissans TaxID=109636 RepID=A0A9P6CWA9_9AGAR|nr:hypothetical protein BDN70DRAFT_898992 [Pholiota conissans]